MALWQDILTATERAIGRFNSGKYTEEDLDQMRLANNRAHVSEIDETSEHQQGSEVISQARTILTEKQFQQNYCFSCGFSHIGPACD